MLVFIVGRTSGQGLFAKTWMNGCFYDLKGNKYAGLISRNETEKSIFVGHGDYIWFKKDKDDEKHMVTSDSMRAYVAGVDSFVVTHVAGLKKLPFIMVVMNEPIKLYLSRQIKRYSSISYFIKYDDDIFYYGTNPDDLTEIKKRNFLDAMSKILTGRPALLEKIKNKEYGFDDLQDIVYYYNGMLAQDYADKNKGN